MVMISRKMLSIQPTAGDNSEMSDIDIYSNGNFGFMPSLCSAISRHVQLFASCLPVCLGCAGSEDSGVLIQRCPRLLLIHAVNVRICKGPG